jgi:hypothetical protein
MTGYLQDYAYNLAAAVRALAPEAHDSHLFALEVRLLILPLHTFFGASARCLMTKHNSIAFFPLPVTGTTARLGSSIGVNRIF